MDFLSIFSLLLALAASIAVPVVAWRRMLPFSRLNYAGFALGTGVVGALLRSIAIDEGRFSGGAFFWILSFLLMGAALGSILSLFFYRGVPKKGGYSATQRR